jgi:hypothetical protein
MVSTGAGLVNSSGDAHTLRLRAPPPTISCSPSRPYTCFARASLGVLDDEPGEGQVE